MAKLILIVIDGDASIDSDGYTKHQCMDLLEGAIIRIKESMAEQEKEVEDEPEEGSPN